MKYNLKNCPRKDGLTSAFKRASDAEEWFKGFEAELREIAKSQVMICCDDHADVGRANLAKEILGE